MATLPPFIFFFHARESFKARSAQDHSGSPLDLMGLRQVSCLPGAEALYICITCLGLDHSGSKHGRLVSVQFSSFKSLIGAT